MTPRRDPDTGYRMVRPRAPDTGYRIGRPHDPATGYRTTPSGAPPRQEARRSGSGWISTPPESPKVSRQVSAR
ncbi:hypothetical protein SGLAM104S_01691 [Streptomyces glaucescens]